MSNESQGTVDAHHHVEQKSCHSVSRNKVYCLLIRATRVRFLPLWFPAVSTLPILRVRKPH